MNDQISIIVPIYNTEKYLPKCINSILSQTHTNLQIILVDDGSTDASGEICDEYAGKDNRIMVIRQNHKGVSAARNTGVAAAVGQYVMFVGIRIFMQNRITLILFCLTMSLLGQRNTNI